MIFSVLPGPPNVQKTGYPLKSLLPSESVLFRTRNIVPFQEHYLSVNRNTFRKLTSFRICPFQDKKPHCSFSGTLPLSKRKHRWKAYFLQNLSFSVLFMTRNMTVPFQEHYLLAKGIPLKSLKSTLFKICPFQDKKHFPFQEHYLSAKGIPLKSLKSTLFKICPFQDKKHCSFSGTLLISKGNTFEKLKINFIQNLSFSRQINIFPFQEHYLSVNGNTFEKLKINFIQNLSFSQQINIFPFQEHYLSVNGNTFKKLKINFLENMSFPGQINIVPFQEHYLSVKGTPLKSLKSTSWKICPFQDK